MDKKTIIKYFQGKLSDSEKEILLDWVNASDLNMKYFMRQFELWNIAGNPGIDKNTDKDIADLKSMARQSIRSSRVAFLKKAGYYSAAAAVAAILVFDIFHRIELNENVDRLRVEYQERVMLSDIPDNLQHVVYTPKGTKAFVDLPDGSRVKLNSDTRITFPDRFTGPTREVAIEGEGYFEVVSDSLVPMVVSTGKGYSVEVKGTKFNVRSYPEDEVSQTTLYEGKVNIVDMSDYMSDRKLLAVLEPGNSYVKKDNLHERPLLVKKSDMDKERAWTEDRMVFSKTPMKEVISTIERWHGVDIVVKDKAVYDILLTAEYGQESVVQIMEAIRFSSGVDFRIDDRTVELFMEK